MSPDEHGDARSQPQLVNGSVPPAIPSEGQTNASVDEGEHEEEEDEDLWNEKEVPEEEVPEAEVSDEHDELSTAKYAIENPLSNGNAYVAAGDYAQMHNYTTYHNITHRYDHLQIVLDSKQNTPEDQDTDVRDIHDVLKQVLAFARQSSITPMQKASPEEAPLPTTHDGFSEWFYGLDEYEQCYAQAAALLHGVSAYEVSKRADELYLLHRVPQNGTPPPTAYAPEILPEELRSSLLTFHNRSSRALHIKTLTITQRVEGVERLYWRDVQSNGISPFHFQFLDFLAGEYLSKGLYGQAFFKQVQMWSQESSVERSMCIASALGVFLWHQNRSELRRQATDWAKRPNTARWQRTAFLLDAAYEIDVIKYPEHEGDENASPTLQLLAEWVERTQKMATKTDVYLGCAAANVYALIGKRKREVALAGLERLLQISSENLLEIEQLQAAVVSAYFALSLSGDIHRVLHSLSSLGEQSLLQHTPPNTMRLRRQHRLQCQLQLKVCLDAFLFIAFDSLSRAAVPLAAAYQEPLPASLSLAERHKRDIILAGILADDETTWHEEVIKLVSAAITEKSSRNSVFDLLERWAHTLLQIQQGSSSQVNQLIASFQRFLVDVGRTLHTWCLDLKHQRRQSPAPHLYKRQLARWSKKKDAFGKLFQQVDDDRW
ncbi:MAG: hypothetical protein J2P36_16160 [Ktedonobacteraceae bacterium]|nr:hypothetical protein [Ktedonobacteraceae bacterium]